MLLLDWLNSGWISAFAVAILWAETAALSMLASRPLRRFWSLSSNACSGTCLLAAVGLALRGDNPLWILALLAGSLVAHGIDIVARGLFQARALSRRTE
jgi:hypothetical protein